MPSSRSPDAFPAALPRGVRTAAWALVAGAAREWFARSPRRVSTIRATGGGMMIGLGGTLLLADNKI